MKIEIKKVVQVEVKYLQVSAGVRHWEDATVDGKEDTEGSLIPCRNGKCWCPKIDIDQGHIVNWTGGLVANIHYKVCDDGIYTLLDENGVEVLKREGYVPDCMCPEENGYGDYIIMRINERGYISNWAYDLSDFQNEEP